jgi:hypothetical protein
VALRSPLPVPMLGSGAIKKSRPTIAPSTSRVSGRDRASSACTRAESSRRTTGAVVASRASRPHAPARRRANRFRWGSACASVSVWSSRRMGGAAIFRTGIAFYVSSHVQVVSYPESLILTRFNCLCVVGDLHQRCGHHRQHRLGRRRARSVCRSRRPVVRQTRRTRTSGWPAHAYAQRGDSLI